jgi:hypothetical protein
MKTVLKSTWMKASLVAVLALAVAFAALSLAPSLAQAQTTTPSPATPQATPAAPQNLAGQAGAARRAALEKAFAHEQTASATQAANLQKIGRVAANAQALITKAQSKGLDVSGLQEALNTFNGQVADAQSLHDTAAGLLSTHAGFDASGKVTGVVAAAQTVRDAHQSLVDARTVIRQAVADLRSAVRAFRAAHKGQTS